MKFKKPTLEKFIFILSAIVILETCLLLKFYLIKPKIVVKKEAPLVGKLAIIIDDWGYNLNNLETLKEIDFPLDVSILPFLPFSKEVAEQARLFHKEVMLHLPLEPHPREYVRLENKVIMVNMPKEKAIKILAEALKSVPNAVGINNHMGSLATENKELMSLIFREIKKNKLFFVDSLVTSNSVCPELAQDLQVKFASRSVFLDNKNDVEYIRGQIRSLIKKVKTQGFAIGIGHDHPSTLKVLKEEAPEIQKQGIKFVFVSEVVK